MDSAPVQRGISAVFTTEVSARRESRGLVLDLLKALEAEGYSSFAPPPRPNDPEWIWDEFCGCRILIVYYEPGAPVSEEFWCKWGVRVDTLCSKGEIIALPFFRLADAVTGA